MSSPRVNVHELRRAQRADGPATVLAIGTANPTTCVTQADYADFYCRVTNSEHIPGLKEKLDNMCQSASGCEKRFFHITEETINAHPEFLDPASPSLDARLELAAAAVPELAATAAAKAIDRWGRPATDITHLVVATNAAANAPGADVRLALLLGLAPTVRRTMLHLNGCSAGAAALRLAKDLAENTRGARVLVVCVELASLLSFRGPDCPHTVHCQATFGDGAGAIIVGADTIHPVEHLMFEMVSATQTLIPRTEHVITMRLTEHGLDGNSDTRELALLAASNIKKCLADALRPIGLDDVAVEWNDLFWVVHPGAARRSWKISRGL